MLKLGDTVVVPRIDRLARNLTEGLRTIEELHHQGINIRSMAERLGHRGRQPYVPSHAYAALPGRVGEGHHPGPDQSRSGPRRGRGPDWRQASGAVIGEGGGRQVIYWENGGSVSAAAKTFGVSRPNHACRQGRDLRGPTPHDLRPHQALGYRTAAKMFRGT